MSRLHTTPKAKFVLAVPAARDGRCNGRKASSEV